MLININPEGNNSVNLTFKVLEAEFEKMIYKVYLETKDNYPVVGMQTGKIPKCIIEEQYGASIFYNDTVNKLIDKEFDQMNNTYNKHKLNRKNVEKINLLQIGKNKDLIFELLVNY